MSFTDELIWNVWWKASAVTISEESLWRKDQCGAWIKRSEYGNRNSQYGWEIDHIIPEPQGGTEDITNLRPLQWQNNVRRHDGDLECPITASSTENVRRTTPKR